MLLIVVARTVKEVRINLKGGFNRWDYHEKLISILAKLGVATLTNFLGGEKAKRYSDMGYPIDASTLSEILLTEKGINVLRDKEIRVNILTTFEPERIKNHFDQKTPKQSINDICAFNWGVNRDTVEFFEVIRNKHRLPSV